MASGRSVLENMNLPTRIAAPYIAADAVPLPTLPGSPMTESEGKKLEGLARSIDALFAGTEESQSDVSGSAEPLPPPQDLIDVSAVDFTSEPMEGSAEAAWMDEPVGGGLEGVSGGDIDLDTLSGVESLAGGSSGMGIVDDPWTTEATNTEPEPLPDVMAEPEPVPPPLPEVAVESEPIPPPLPEVAAEPEPSVAIEPEPSVPMETELGLAGIGTEPPPDVVPALVDTGTLPAVDADVSAVGDDDDSTPLDAAVDVYLAGDTAQAGEIEELAAGFAGRQELDPVARSVERLILAAGDPADADKMTLARSLMTPLVLERVVRRMGRERTEERRHDYYQICRSLGDEMAEAIKSELGETTTDRLARRIYCEALTEMGPSGRAMIESMIEDDNQFIVRNAVSILGDVGGDNAVALVTSALANSDRRVRREALKSLAKLGDPEAGEWVLGFLDDPDEEVRMAAAVATGELKVGRALRPLLAMLDGAKNPDQAMPLIRALGHIGDPGAVVSIEKYAVPGLLRRPRTDVRITAYRALHQIGTPHCKQLLLDVAKDKDEAVQEAVKGMLYG